MRNVYDRMTSSQRVYLNAVAGAATNGNFIPVEKAAMELTIEESVDLLFRFARMEIMIASRN